MLQHWFCMMYRNVRQCGGCIAQGGVSDVRVVVVDRPLAWPMNACDAAKTALFIRNTIVREFGGQGGVQPQGRNLHLFSLVSPAWVRPGNRLEIRNAVTEMGAVSATMTFREGCADVTIQPDFHSPAARMAIAVPYFVELLGVRVDDDRGDVQGCQIYLPPTQGASLSSGRRRRVYMMTPTRTS